jgi:carboxypeptidase C (cathepsin A)
MTKLHTAIPCLLLALAAGAYAQPKKPPQPAEEKATPVPQATPPAAARPTPEAARPEEAHPARSADHGEEKPHEIRFDMTEPQPVVTHHQIEVGGRALHYTATVGQLPIKDTGGTTEALMFYVAYTLDGAAPNERPLTFAFNGGPGSASIWLHMGALGPRKVVLQQQGFLPAAPYRLEDNASTLLDNSDLVLIDAIGTGFSRPATLADGKKFWGVEGDIRSFGEFIRLYITRNERWSSPLFLFGESYGTTRAAGVSSYLANRGISFNGIVLLSTVLSFETLEWNKTNDLPYPFLLPSFAMIAAFHHKLAPDLTSDLGKMRDEVEHWASNEYALALAKGDALTPPERQEVIDRLARYTGLSKQFIDETNLRVNVGGFTHRLLADQKLRVGRLDGRFTGPDPEGFEDTRFYDPTITIQPPFTSVFNDYIRRELGYKTDAPYYVMAHDAWGPAFQWDWGKSIQGFPDTATALREAMVTNPYLKVLVLEGYYDLATPYYAVDYTMDHLDLTPQYRKNISFATSLAGHMVYLDSPSLVKMKKDVGSFIEANAPHGH